MKENDIRPQNIFQKFLSLSVDDIPTYFSNVELLHQSCPACGEQASPVFEKHGFTYERCPGCKTLFVNPRPVKSAFERYYTESPSSKFWADEFYRETALSRRALLWKPKAHQIKQLLDNYATGYCSVIDIGGGFGLFAEAFNEITGKLPQIIEPSPGLAAACREKSLPVIEKFLEDVEDHELPSGQKCFVSFELIEHLPDPNAFLHQLKHLMKKEDLFIFTTLSGTGVDILALGESSKSVSPPHHLNFFNPWSIELLLTKLGFDCLQVTTPGKLDIDILCNNEALIKDPFWRTFLDLATEEHKSVWQHIISETKWSSHMMVVCRKGT